MAKAATSSLTRAQSLELVLGKLDNEYGPGTVMKLGAGATDTHQGIVRTGSIGLDAALGIGGLPRGRVVEIYGPESSGKTTLGLEIVAQAQALGDEAVFVDAENALDPEYARRIGVDVDRLLVAQPDHGEQGLQIVDVLVKSAAVGVVVVDSVAALTPKAEVEGNMGDAHVGLQARLMSQALRKLASSIKRSNTLVVFINQIRMKIGTRYANPETTTGGNALKFYSSVRLDIRRGDNIERQGEVLGNRTRIKVVKNKMAPPFRTADLEIIYGTGFCMSGEIIDWGIEHGLVHKNGAWYSYGEERIGQGREQTRAYLDAHPQMRDELDAALRARMLEHGNTK